MPSTRRQVLVTGSSLLIPLAGCTGSDPTTATIAELEVEFANGTNEEHVFHVAVETADGLGEWISRAVAPGTRDSVVREPPTGYDPIRIHGVVDEHAIRGELIGDSGETSGDICLRIVFEYGLGEEPSLLQSTDVRC